MAPLLRRQFHSFSPASPGPPKGPSTTPVPVDKTIDPVVFGELFAGTVGIFVLAVVFWKLGRCIRSFNRHKVVGQGKIPTARYARTWYGWVSLETHQRNKRFISNCLTRMRRWIAWRSSRVSYSWVWWDPGQKEFQRRQQDRKLLVRWLPKWLRSYDFTPPDDMWNVEASPKCHGALLNTKPDEASGPTTSPPRTQETARSMLKMTHNVPRRSRATRPRLCQELFRTPTATSDGAFYQGWRSTAVSNTVTFTSHSQPLSDESLVSSTSPRPSHVSRSMGTWPAAGVYRFRSERLDQSCGHVRFDIPNACHHRRRNCKSTFKRDKPISGHRFRHVNTYRRWSTKMQLQAPKALRDWKESSGPPGTPDTQLLISCASEQAEAVPIRPYRQKMSNKGRAWESSFRESRNVTLGFGRCQRDEFASNRWNSAPVRFRPARSTCFLEVAAKGMNGWQSLRDSTVLTMPNTPTVDSPHEGKKLTTKAHHRQSHSASEARGLIDLSDWEVRLMNRLDRKLVWLFNEFTPGQKPYHFALLANHWLNRETWIVIDPVSRVPIDARRQWGDPRFNLPYPEPQWSRKTKYPAVSPTPVRVARIDSWRNAVNQQRRASGVRDRIRTVQLFKESADEAPDGQIDPACWVLPKPPQGFEMSTKQKNAWYEGGTGWQEKLEDWQQVRRGYRVRKAAHEGRVNRTRAKAFVTQINKCCRTAPLKLMPSRAAELSPC